MILITSAGKVGSEAARLLAQQGEPVRVLVRDAGKATVLAQAGAEIAEGDLDVPPTIDAAMQGVSAVVLVYADLGRLLFVQEVTLAGGSPDLVFPQVSRLLRVLVGDRGWGMTLRGAKWAASRLIHVLPNAADGRPEWVPRRASQSATSARST